MEKKILPTGVVIHYHNNGNINFIESPYYGQKKGNPVRGSISSYLKHIIKNLIK